MMSVIVLVKSTLPEGSATPGLIISLIEEESSSSSSIIKFARVKTETTSKSCLQSHKSTHKQVATRKSL